MGSRTRLRRIAWLPAALIGFTGCTVPTVPEADAAPPTSARSGRAETIGAGTMSASEAAQTAGVQATVQAQVQAEVRRLSVRRLAAQLVVPDLGSVREGVTGIRTTGYGGVVVMRTSLPTGRGAAAAAAKANAEYTAAVRASGRSWPAFIAVDQEGGPVTRLDAPLTPFPAAMALGATGRPDLARAVGRASGSELRGLGFTVVMAPDADVTSEGDPTIGVRSPGSDPGAVARTALGYVQGYRDAGMLPVVKHFPGHGSVRSDTHEGAAVLTASRATLDARDLAPFRAAVRGGAPAIMTAHVTATALDPRRPASMSSKVTTGLLRGELGFRGLVVTDALNMGAVTAGTRPGEATVRAIEAGADVALMPADPAAAVTALEQAVKSGRLSRARLEQSAVRMITALRSQRATVAPASPGSHASVARAVARASITQLGGTCGTRLVGDAVTVTGGTAADRASFTRAARAAGLRIGGPGATRVVLLGGGVYRAGSAASSGDGSASGEGDVVVAVDTPYGLARPGAKARLAAYGRTPATFDAVVDVLTGRLKAPGALPVKVGTWGIGTRCG